jgi:hypothetical protein
METRIVFRQNANSTGWTEKENNARMIIYLFPLCGVACYLSSRDGPSTASASGVEIGTPKYR